ncbi:cytochrome c3 family protein [Acanthopleuribacter pedis]|uniref:Cytochrome c7-like domain-containing protein n=1 Tax=Acanthopleuribacter pedis TaxID=442870 RepID=A0A8J7Q6J9_9BACT|nr:cytochrome c3 family protein [Acanthopleuribacter pedis]MBO1319081.1 hypothetical protein [Acanthopleuribacter pedis]
MAFPGNRDRHGRHLTRMCLLSLLMLVGCSGPKPPHPARVADTIAAHEGPVQGPDTAHLTAELNRVRAEFPGRLQAADFFVETRVNQLKQAPCAQCHAAPVDLDKAPKAHWDIQLEHAGNHMMQCSTCHDPGDHKSSLIFLSGAALSMDHVYQQCGQCHFEQLRDWEGGAHGQRVAAWSGERVVRNCTGCHDPHQPAFPKRWPVHAARPADETLPIQEISHPEEGSAHD